MKIRNGRVPFLAKIGHFTMIILVKWSGKEEGKTEGRKETKLSINLDYANDQTECGE